MKLRPLYDVKERLEQAAIAGTGLLGEDFRLIRAAEGLKPLAAASPVFGKIDAGLQALLASPAGERGGRLLDLLALVDAVAYTQGSAGLDGELTPLPAGGGSYQPVSYGQLQPLLTALTTTGGGRMEIIQSTWETHPAFFTDFRVLPAVASGLGDSYGEIGELNAKILKGMGPSVLPLLKQDFDPAGKKEMVRRVEVIAALTGAAATPWLLEVLPDAKKEVRAAVLIALGNDTGNIPLLLDLSKAERGNHREAVLQALAQLDGPAVQDFWRIETTKKPEHVEFLKFSRTGWASDLATAKFQAALESLLREPDQDIQFTSEDLSALNHCKPAVLGKSSPAMLNCWRWIDSQLPRFGKLNRSPAVRHVNLGEDLLNWLLDSLCAAGPSPLCDLSLELWEHSGRNPRYLPHAVLTALFTRPASEAYEAFAPHAARSTKLRTSNVLESLFQRIFWDKQTGCYLVSHNRCQWLNNCGTQVISLAHPLDRRWFDLLFQIPNMDSTLRRLIPPDDLELSAKLMAYQYRKILDGGHFTQEDVAFLRDHGWTQWKGFLDKKVKKDGSFTLFAVTRLLNETSLTGPEKAAELGNLYKIVQAQSAAKKRPTWPDQRVKDQIAAWEADI